MTKLNFTYNDGRGRLEINLDNLLPCAPADFKRLLSFVNLSDCPDDHAAEIFDFISGKVDELKKERKVLNPENPDDKKLLARNTATTGKYLTHAATLSKVYGLPELDAGEKITFKRETVYALWKNKAGKQIIKTFAGWTFCKGGFTFDVYKSGKSCYTVLLHGTGTEVSYAPSRGETAENITPRILESLKKVNIHEFEQVFKRCMIESGFMEDDERAENISNVETKTENNTENEEVNTMTNYEFTKDTITIDGTTYPAEYNIIESGSVLAFAIVSTEADGYKHKKRIRFSPDYPEYADALNAATLAGAKQPEQKRPEIISEATPAAKVEDKPEPEIVYTDENGARDPKAARGPVPEKTFIGSVIEGRGWKILFDGIASRTRVIFESDPTDAARAAIENAGFYYSPNMKSWNKKLTFRAYRAAQTLSCRLNELYAA